MQVSIESNHSAIVTDYTQLPQWVPHKLRELGEADVLIQVQASTINPSDLLSTEGFLPQMTTLPYASGKQGVGKVIQTGDKSKEFQGKRVCFSDLNLSGGGWANFIVVPTSFIFVIDEDVPVSSAASGVINPITVLGMISEVKRRNINSIIHTAAASALGRMLNKICKTEGITLLNIVRRQEHADILKNEGAEHVIVTTGEWQNIYITKIKELKSKALFDALGGGDVQAKIINHLPGDAFVFIYGLLEGKDPSKPTTINPTNLISGLTVCGFMLSNWFLSLTKQEQKQLRQKYSNYLKTDLSSTFAKSFKFSQIAEAIQEYKKNPTNGKILLRP